MNNLFEGRAKICRRAMVSSESYLSKGAKKGQQEYDSLAREDLLPAAVRHGRPHSPSRFLLFLAF